MKSKESILVMLLARLTELRESNVKEDDPALAGKLRGELELLYEILGEDVLEEYWDEIESEIYY